MDAISVCADEWTRGLLGCTTYQNTKLQGSLEPVLLKCSTLSIRLLCLVLLFFWQHFLALYRQAWVGVVPTGPSGHPMDSSYKCREDPEYKEDFGNAMVNFARVIPDGLLVFFPSYIVMQSCLDYWRRGRHGMRTWSQVGF